MLQIELLIFERLVQSQLLDRELDRIALLRAVDDDLRRKAGPLIIGKIFVDRFRGKLSLMKKAGSESEPSERKRVFGLKLIGSCAAITGSRYRTT